MGIIPFTGIIYLLPCIHSHNVLTGVERGKSMNGCLPASQSCCQR